MARWIALFLLIASAAFARGINLHVYTLDEKGRATQIAVLETARGARCSGPLVDRPEVTSCQSFFTGELLVINRARLRFVEGGKVRWERALSAPVAFQGTAGPDEKDGPVIALEVKGGLELRWIDADGKTTRTEQLRASTSTFKPPEWCGDSIQASYETTSKTLAGAVCLVLD